MEKLLSGLPTHEDMRAVRQEYAQGDFRTLQEVSTLIGHMRTDVKEWISSSREENKSSLQIAKGDIMDAISKKLEPAPAPQRNGWHPAVTYTGTAMGGGGIASFILWLLGLLPHS